MAVATSVKLEDELSGRVKTLADARRRSLDSILQEAIAQYVDREEKRDAFHMAARQAWNDYRRTGLHLTAAEADAWLATLEAGEDAEPPKCHV